MKKIFAILIILFFITGSLIAQDYGSYDAGSRLDRVINSSEEFTLQDSYYIGRAVAAQILSNYRLYNDKARVTRYLNMICGALTVNSSPLNVFNGFHVMILDSQIPNAFSTPGGHIFLTRGLIDLASSEDMLAAVIAHEIAHVQLKHGLDEIKQDRLVKSLGSESERLARITEQGLNNNERSQVFSVSVNELVQTLFTRGYSRLQEFEADNAAVTLLAAAGYSTNGLPEMLKKLQKIQNDSISSSISSTHPSSAERLANIEKQANFSRAKDTSASRKNRFLRITGNSAN